MIVRRLATLALALGLLTSTFGSALAMPAAAPSGGQPPGIAAKTFVDEDEGHVQRRLADLGFAGAARSLQTMAAATTEEPCATPGYASCPTYVYTGVHWPAGTRMVFYINKNFNATRSATLTRSAVTLAVDGAFRIWGLEMPKPGGMTFVDLGTTSALPGRYDGRNVIGWGWLPAGTIAQTTVWYNSTSGRIVEADMTLNSSLKWAYTPSTTCNVASLYCNPGPAGPPGAYDLRDVVTHEAGHMLMLDDLFGWSNRSLTMYGYERPNQRAKTSLGRGDRLGVKAAY